ncbi:MAG: glycosyltransferase family 4 protein [Firmicutes bacterium]|nr:glycosyltransferase family 4 protein [Bacillota bacterium]
MRICMLSWRGSTHPKAGGAETYTKMLLEGLQARGHEVLWYVGDPGPERRVSKTVGGVPLVYGAAGMRVYWSGHQWIRRHAAEFDIVVDQLNTFGFLAPAVTKPVVALIHQLAMDVWDYECPPGISQAGRLIEQWVLRQYRHTPFVTVSPSTLTDLRAHGWNGPGAVIPNVLESVAPRVGGTRAPNPTLVFLGRFASRAKRLDHAVAIFRRVRRTIPTAQLWVIGRGQPPRWLHREPGVTIYANVSAEERDALLASAWGLIATSVREGWGRMVMEAAAQGTPAVVYDVPGLRDAVVSEETGIIVPPKVDIAAAAILCLWRNPVLMQQLGEAALCHVSRTGRTQFIAGWEAVLQDVIRKSNLETRRVGTHSALG